jgi:hypothetical protein
MTQQQIDDITTGLTAMSAGMAKLANAFAGIKPVVSELLNEEALQDAVVEALDDSYRVQIRIKDAIADSLVHHLRFNDAVRSEIQTIVQGELDDCEMWPTSNDVEQIIEGYGFQTRDDVEEVIDEKAPDWTELKSAFRTLADTL